MSGSPLRALAPELWVVDRPQRFFGFPIGTRMTVVRLAGGGLWLCSPVEPDADLSAALDALGPVEHLVGPNRFHHLYLGPMLERYPKASLHLAPGLAEKRPDLPPSNPLAHAAPSEWSGEIDQRVLEGVPAFNEVAFLHRRSRTLILTDHLFHLDERCPLAARALGVTLGVRRAPGLPLDARLLFIKDKARLTRSIQVLLSWDFERIVLTHGSIVEDDAKQVLRQAYAFLLDAAPTSSSPATEPKDAVGADP